MLVPKNKQKKTSNKCVGFSRIVSKPPFSGMNLDGNQLRHAKERPVKVGQPNLPFVGGSVGSGGWMDLRSAVGLPLGNLPTDLTCNFLRGSLEDGHPWRM